MKYLKSGKSCAPCKFKKYAMAGGKTPGRQSALRAKELRKAYRIFHAVHRIYKDNRRMNFLQVFFAKIFRQTYGLEEESPGARDKKQLHDEMSRSRHAIGKPAKFFRLAETT
ncbi:MAG: hypothetical protein LBR94_07835 [Desulfovibrio sp.]|jgi:hypothetical protein|nr:hypothetical protein [Desulfovibrio sp.]